MPENTPSEVPVEPSDQTVPLTRAERRATESRAAETRPEAEPAATESGQSASSPGGADAPTNSVEPAPKRSRKKGWIIAAAIAVPVLAIGALGLALGLRALDVKDELTAAQDLVPQATAAAKELDVEKAQATFAEISHHTAKAVELTDDPLWGFAEQLPWIGTSARAVTEMAAVTDDTITAVEPLLELAPSLMPENLVPVDGKFPVEVLVEAGPVVQTLSNDVSDLQARLAAVDVEGTPGMLVDGKAKLTDALTQAGSALETADKLLAVAPDMLGANGERRYLLVFQNNAETLALGGSAASQTLVGAKTGKIEMLEQAGSQDFDNGNEVDVEITDAERNLYGERYGSYVNLLPSRPDWPTAAQQARAFWQRDIDGGAVHGVASIDPLALQRILGATGPITVDGVEINQDNAVQILLHDVYTWWEDPMVMVKESDAFFATVAETVFDKVASGQFDFGKMVTAVELSIDAGSIMYWTDNPEVAGILDGMAITGVLPTDNIESTTLGVFFRDTSASKIDSYVKTAVDAVATCADGAMTLTTTAAVTFDTTAAELAKLPRYITGVWNGEKIRPQVFIYAPLGMQIDSVSVDGREVGPFRQGNIDLGRAVAPFQMYLTPGESASVTATFSGTGEFGPLAMRMTPMINPTAVSIGDECG